MAESVLPAGMVVSTAVFAVVLGLVVWGFAFKVARDNDAGLYERLAHAGREGVARLWMHPRTQLPLTTQPDRNGTLPFSFACEVLRGSTRDHRHRGPAGRRRHTAFHFAAAGPRPARTFGRVAGIGIMVVMLSGAAALTGLGIANDRQDESYKKRPPLTSWPTALFSWPSLVSHRKVPNISSGVIPRHRGQPSTSATA